MASSGVDAIGEVPLIRWDATASPAMSEAIACRARHCGFALGVQCFDNSAFSVSPAEASAMDPQQRLLLEQGYLVLHDAELGRSTLSNGFLVGTFVGIEMNDFAEVLKSSCWQSLLTGAIPDSPKQV